MEALIFLYGTLCGALIYVFYRSGWRNQNPYPRQNPSVDQFPSNQGYYWPMNPQQILQQQINRNRQLAYYQEQLERERINRLLVVVSIIIGGLVIYFKIQNDNPHTPRNNPTNTSKDTVLAKQEAKYFYEKALPKKELKKVESKKDVTFPATNYNTKNTKEDEFILESHFLQAGLFNNDQDVKRQLAELKKLNLPAKVRDIETNGKLLQQVLVGPFATERDALSLRNQLGESTWISVK